MVEQRKKQKTKRRDKNRGLLNEVTKEEYAVAKYARFNCPTKTATILGNEMHYFTASKAIDCLMASKKWGGGGNDEKPKLFPNRQSCVVYMQTLLDKGLLFRAKKLVPKRKDRDAVAGSTDPTGSSDKNATSLRKDSKSKHVVEETKEKEKDIKETTQKSTATTKKQPEKSATSAKKSSEPTPPTAETNEKETGNKKKSKKIKFEVHQIQEFNDSNDIYVWKYDPTSTKMFCLGLAMVLGSIGVCLFPLWPPEVRLGVYYLSVAAMIFVGLIVILVILRCVLFALVWLVTFGKHHFWLLPHLTDDCGFFDSFKPLYSHNVVEKTGSSSDDDGGKKDSAGAGKDGGTGTTGKDRTATGSVAENSNNKHNDFEEADEDDDNSGAEQDDKNSEDEENDGKQSFSESEQLSDEEDDGSNTESVHTGTEEDRIKRKKDA